MRFRKPSSVSSGLKLPTQGHYVNSRDAEALSLQYIVSLEAVLRRLLLSPPFTLKNFTQGYIKNEGFKRYIRGKVSYEFL